MLAALLAASYRSNFARPRRGAMAALAGLTKFAPLALAPVLATDGLRAMPARAPADGALALFVGAFLVAGALAFIPALAHDSLHTIYERTLAYQGNRGSPFSVWGLYGCAGPRRASRSPPSRSPSSLALVPRRRTWSGSPAACAAVILGVQLRRSNTGSTSTSPGSSRW